MDNKIFCHNKPFKTCISKKRYFVVMAQMLTTAHRAHWWFMPVVPNHQAMGQQAPGRRARKFPERCMPMWVHALPPCPAHPFSWWKQQGGNGCACVHTSAWWRKAPTTTTGCWFMHLYTHSKHFKHDLAREAKCNKLCSWSLLRQEKSCKITSLMRVHDI